MAQIKVGKNTIELSDVNGRSSCDSAFMKANRPAINDLAKFEQPKLESMIPLHETKQGILFSSEDYSQFCYVTDYDDETPEESGFAFFKASMVKHIDGAWQYLATSKQSALGKIKTQADDDFVVGMVETSNDESELYLSGEEIAALIIVCSIRSRGESEPETVTYVLELVKGATMPDDMLNNDHYKMVKFFGEIKIWRECRRAAKINAKAAKVMAELNAQS